MCLYVNKDLTRRMLDDDWDSRSFHKVFVWSKGKLVTPYHMHAAVQGVASFPVKAVPKDDMVGAGAFHLRLSEEELTPDKFIAAFNDLGPPVCAKVWAKKEDVIAYGQNGDVAVRAYEIREDEWARINKGAGK